MSGYKVGADISADTWMSGAVAVIGLGCRFPGGADSPESFWDLMAGSVDAVTEPPPGRFAREETHWPQGIPRWGGFLDGIDGFDADFFGISAREATAMDPQQRLALEVAWESLEHAFVPPSRLRGSRTGVFLGAWSSDYARHVMSDHDGIDAWTGIGTSLGGIASRVSHALGLRGPSLVTDTACSASLTAVHLACHSLLRGESELALAGGVNLLLSSALHANFERAGALSPDGRCKTFDASADGYVRSEGCGFIVLKRHADAVRDGDRILALIRGTSTNQDGHTNGIMQPSTSAQADMIRDAHQAADIGPETIDYVEAHGTGTPVGDSVEVTALGLTFGTGRAPGVPCLMGSVKTNIGHTESAAGIAGLIKTVMALSRAEIPPNLHFHEPNPELGLDELNLDVVTELTPWPDTGRPRRAAVSSFGFGGANAHAVLESVPDTARAEREEWRASTLFPLSARSAPALADNAARLADAVESAPGTGPSELTFTLAHGREHGEHRAAVVADSPEKLVTRLRSLAADEPAEGVEFGQARTGPGPVWVFSGHGSQWSGMGQGLLVDEPEFASAIDALDPHFEYEAGFSVRRALESGRVTGTVDEVQPVLYAVQVALARTWQSYGIEPELLMGHSVGEIAAVVIAGSLSVEDGVKVVVRRSRLMARVSGQGLMAMVELPADEVAERLSGESAVSLAVYASPTQSVIAGDAGRVTELVQEWTEMGLLTRLVKSDVASHSPQMDQVLGELGANLADISPNATPNVPMLTTVLDDPEELPAYDAEYWRANLRRPVRFAPAVQAALARGHRTFVEVSPHPTLTYNLREILEDTGITDGVVLPTLRRNQPERATLLASLGGLYCAGHAHDWSRLAASGSFVDVPTNSWQHQSYWVEVSETGPGTGSPVAGSGSLLGTRTTLPMRDTAAVWTARLGEDTAPYPGGHKVGGRPVVPASSLLCTLLESAGGGTAGVADVELRAPLSPSDTRTVTVTEQAHEITLSSSSTDGSNSRIVHTRALVCTDTGGEVSPLPALSGARTVDPRELDEALSAAGAEGRAFDWTVNRIERSVDGADVGVESTGQDPSSWAYWLDPALQAPLLCVDPEETPMLPAGVAKVCVYTPVPRSARIAVRRWKETSTEGSAHFDVQILDGEDGEVALALEGLVYRGLGGAVDSGPTAFGTRWEAADREHVEGSEPPARVVLVGPDEDLWTGLSEATESGRTQAVRVGGPDELDDLPSVEGWTAVVLAPPRPGPEVHDAVWPAVLTSRRLSRWHGHVRLWLCTRGVREAESSESVSQGALWGIAPVLANEEPDRWGGLVDLEPGVRPRDLLRELFVRHTGDDVVALRSGVPEVPRLVPLDEGRQERVRCRAGATYVVTGGLGALGGRMALRLADLGARRLILVSRRPLPPRSVWDLAEDPETLRRVALVRALEERGVAVRVVVSESPALTDLGALIDPDQSGWPAVRGVVHAAGISESALVADLDENSLRAVIAPKAEGARELDALFPPGSLDFLLLFSSVGSFLGIPGQAAYAAANASLDALARRRRSLGCATTSVRWTVWRGLGFAASSETGLTPELLSRGIGDLDAAAAEAALEVVERHGEANPAVLRLVPAEAPARATILPPVTSFETEDDSAGEEGGFEHLAGLAVPQARSELRALVVQQVAHELRVSSASVDPERPFSELGMESIMSLGVRRRLEDALSLKLPATLLWNHPTATKVADVLLDRLRPEGAEPGRGTRPSDEHEPVPVPSGGLSDLLSEVESGRYEGQVR